MKECEDCGDGVARRTRCSRCGKLVCRWCYHHAHGLAVEDAEYHVQVDDVKPDVQSGNTTMAIGPAGFMAGPSSR